MDVGSTIVCSDITFADQVAMMLGYSRTFVEGYLLPLLRAETADIVGDMKDLTFSVK